LRRASENGRILPEPSRICCRMRAGVCGVAIKLGPTSSLPSGWQSSQKLENTSLPCATSVDAIGPAYSADSPPELLSPPGVLEPPPQPAAATTPTHMHNFAQCIRTIDRPPCAGSDPRGRNKSALSAECNNPNGHRAVAKRALRRLATMSTATTAERFCTLQTRCACERFVGMAECHTPLVVCCRGRL